MTADRYAAGAELRDGVTEPNVLASIWRHRFIVAGVTCAIAVLGLFASSLRAPVYAAEAGLLLEDPRNTARTDLRPVKDQVRYAADQIAILESVGVSERAIVVAAETETKGSLHPAALRRNMTVRSSETSNYVTIKLVADDPKTAQVFANAVVIAYREIVRATIDAESRAAIARLDAAIKSANQRLASLSRRGVAEVQRQDTIALLDQLRERRSLLLVDAQLMGDGVSLFTQAQLGKREGVSRSSTLAIAIALGLVLGAGLAYWLDARKQVFSSRFGPESLLDAPALAEIPDFTREDLDTDIPVLNAAWSHAAEAFRFLAFGIGLPRTWADGEKPAEEDDSWKDKFPGLTDRELAVLDLVAAGLSSADVAATLPGLNRAKVDYTIRSILEKLGEADREKLVMRVQAAGRNRTRDSVADVSRLVAFVSASDGAGTSTLVANTAVAAAHEGQRVLLVDADLEKRGRSRAIAALGASKMNRREPGSKVGLTDLVLQGVAVERIPPVLETTSGGSLSVLGPGRATVDPMRVFRSDQVTAALDALHQSFDVIFLDVPPLLRVAYSAALVRSARAVVVVVPHGGEAARVKHLRDRLDLLEVRPIGYVYNQLPGRRETSARRIGGVVGTLLAELRRLATRDLGGVGIPGLRDGKVDAESRPVEVVEEPEQAAVVRRLELATRSDRAWVERRAAVRDGDTRNRS